MQVWQYSGSTWTSYSAYDLTYDRTYASMTVTSLGTYAVTGDLVLNGDANRDGTVNGTDLNTVLSKLQSDRHDLGKGDFDGNGTVNGADLNTVLSNFNQTISVTATVPEPSTLFLLGIGAIGLLSFACRRRRGRARCLSCAAVVVAMLLAGSAQADVFNMGGTRNPTTGTWTGAASLQFVTVGNPGNAANSDGCGSVPYTYQMGKYDVTLGQYCQFLNAVATTSDPYGLYYSYMGTDMPTWPSPKAAVRATTVTRSRAATPRPQTVRFSMSRGRCSPLLQLAAKQPTDRGRRSGHDGDGGVHAQWQCHQLDGGDAEHRGHLRHSVGERMVQGGLLRPKQAGRCRLLDLPDEEQHDTGEHVAGRGNSANCMTQVGTFTFSRSDPTNYLTPVGAFALSPGPYGTYDQGGNVQQWNETNFGGSSRGFRGGSWTDFAGNLSASSFGYGSPTNEQDNFGFRVAEVPEPGSIALIIAGGLCLPAYDWRRRRQAT